MSNEIIVGKNSGFCFGVKNVVDRAYQLLDDNKDLYCYGEIVHNKDVISSLKDRGLKFIDNLDTENSDVIVRAHGITKEERELALKRNINLIDLTCPFVLKTHELVEDYQKKNYFIILIGKHNHPEVVGTFSYCGNNAFNIESTSEIDELIDNIKKTSIKNIFIIVQTTFNEIKYHEIVSEIKNKLDNSYDIDIKNTICHTTKDRQLETIELSKNVDVMIIIGGKNSSNTKELYNSARKYCHDTYLIENCKDLKNYHLDNRKIGIMAGASTPSDVINEVVDYLKEMS